MIKKVSSLTLRLSLKLEKKTSIEFVDLSTSKNLANQVMRLQAIGSPFPCTKASPAKRNSQLLETVVLSRASSKSPSLSANTMMNRIGNIFVCGPLHHCVNCPENLGSQVRQVFSDPICCSFLTMFGHDFSVGQTIVCQATT